jgi:hypothetical protein
MTPELTATISTIKTYELDIEQTKEQVKTITEQIKDELESMPSYHAVQEAEAALADAKTRLKQELLGNADYNDMLETKGQLGDQLRDQKDILSEHIIAYYGLTQERQLQIEDDGDARELILKGSLGKKQKYQTSLFGGRDE